MLIDPARPRQTPELGFVASLALVEALDALLGGDPALKIKWPNDILHGGAKLAGILLESAPTAQGLACVAGFGVNCASNPGDTLYPATNLSKAAGRGVTPDAVLEALSQTMAKWLDVWARGAGFPAIRAEWLAHAAGVGGGIRVTRQNDTLEGVFSTIDAAGRLCLKQASGEIAIDAGDVFWLPQPGRADI